MSMTGKKRKSLHKSEYVEISQVTKINGHEDLIGTYEIRFAREPGKFYEFICAMSYLTKEDVIKLSQELDEFVSNDFGKKRPHTQKKFNRFANIDVV